MTFLPLHRDKKHKYKNGLWTWQHSKLKFHSHTSIKEEAKEETKSDMNPHDNVGLKFTDYIEEAEERSFQTVFQNPSSFGDVITIQDVKNLALFTLKTKSSLQFIEFLHTFDFDKFLHATIFYIDFFLRTLEFLLIRRDEFEIEGKVRDMLSMRVERFLSKQMSDRRLLMAREYANILVPLHQRKGRKNLTAEKDLKFFEALIDFTIQCVFITMHRRAFNAICEFPFHFFASSQFFSFYSLFNPCSMRVKSTLSYGIF